MKRGKGEVNGKAYLLFDDIPLLSRTRSQLAPDLFAHGHILLGKTLKFDIIPIVGISAFGEALVTLPAGVGSLGGEVGVLDLVPVEALSSSLYKLLVILRRPCPGTRPVRCGKNDGRIEELVVGRHGLVRVLNFLLLVLLVLMMGRLGAKWN